MSIRPSRILFIIIGAAVFGFVVFGILASRVTTIEKVNQDAVRDRLGITPKDIARQGPGVILDEIFANGDRLLVWAE